MSMSASTTTSKLPPQKPSTLDRVLRFTRKKPKPRQSTRPTTIMSLPRELRQEILLLSLGNTDQTPGNTDQTPGNTDQIPDNHFIGNKYVEQFIDGRRRETLSKRTKALQAVHPCLDVDVAYVVGNWWESHRRQTLDLREEIRVFRKGYLDGSILQDWNQTVQNRMFEIAVFARVIAILEYYEVHPVKGILGGWCARFGIANRFVTGRLRIRMPSTMHEHIEVARVFLRLPEDED